MYFINGILFDTHTKNSEKIGYFGYGIGYDTRMISGTLKKTGYQCMTLNKHKLAAVTCIVIAGIMGICWVVSLCLNAE